jgi:hypothetical protein
MRHLYVCGLLALLTASVASADVSILEHRAGRSGHKVKKSVHTKKAERKGRLRHIALADTGSQSLTDGSGLQYFIDTDITFSTASSASGAASEASYNGPVAATTSAGGTTSSTLDDAFDGYNGLCVSLTGATSVCSTQEKGGATAGYVLYEDNGPPSTDCGGRQLLFNPQTIGALQVSRKLFVPSNDSFARWLNVFTNNGLTPVSFTMTTANDLGSDSNTRIVSTSDGDTIAELTDTWVSTFQNYSGNTSSDPRLGHVLQGPGAAAPLVNIQFADGDELPSWSYAITLAPGETKSILNFVTGQPSKAAANAKAAELVDLPVNAVQCLSDTELSQIANFVTAAPPPPPPPPPPATVVPTLSEVGLVALALLVASAALVRLRR